MLKKVLFILLHLGITLHSASQQCSVPGQTPVSAIFVCSAETFTINTPEFCGQTNIPTPCTDGAIYQNKNPNFFRFGCYAAGTLAFTIVPNQANVNYNWQLFDVTNTNPVDIFTNSSLFVACNWSSELGETGASSDGTNLMVCSGSSQPLFSKMPDLQTGHTYMLMVSNESASVAGYQITFSGGTAVITDAADPHLLVADISCDRTRINLRLNKQVKCNTLAADGSDFTVSGGANILSAVPGDCTTQFGTGSLSLLLDRSLGYGTFSLTMKDGSDGNTLVDVCNRSIPSGETIFFVSAPQQFTPMDSVFNISCKPDYIELVFRTPILCNSVAPDGSDFLFTGPQAISCTPFIANCSSNGTTRIVRLNFSGSVIPGNYQVRLATGSDGNSILNECLVSTPPGSTVSFAIAQSVNAVFTQSNNTSCSQSRVAFMHPGANNVSSWNWDFGNGVTSQLNNPVIDFQKGNYVVRLIVSNGTCSDTSSQTLVISDAFKAAFSFPDKVCPGEQLQLNDMSVGNIDSWSWNFGNSQTSNLQNPLPFSYSDNGTDNWYTVQLVVSNRLIGCRDSVRHTIRKLKSCLVSVPTAFTPNNDGKNDFLYPLNALKADNLDFKVYNRNGTLVFSTKDWTRKWDGKLNGQDQGSGIYAWILNFTDRDTGEKRFMKGTSLLLR